MAHLCNTDIVTDKDIMRDTLLHYQIIRDIKKIAKINIKKQWCTDLVSNENSKLRTYLLLKKNMVGKLFVENITQNWPYLDVGEFP